MRKPNATTVRVTHTESTDVPIEVLAESIVSMSQGIKKLRAGKLNDRALYLLIQGAAPYPIANGKPLTIAQIKAVFAGIESLEATYLKKGAQSNAR